MPKPLMKWKVGQPISEDRLNLINQWIEMLSKMSAAAPIKLVMSESGPHFSFADIPSLDLVELDEHIEAGELNKTCHSLYLNTAADPSDEDQLLKAGDDQKLYATMDTWRSVYLEGHRALTWYFPQFEQQCVVPGFNFHVVEITSEEITAGGSGDAKILTPISGSLADASPTLTIEVNDIRDSGGGGDPIEGGARCIVLQHNVGGKWWIVPAVSGGGGMGGMITVELPSDLALTDATKATCIVKATFSGGPTIDDVAGVTITNPPAKGGNYQFQATAATQHVNAMFQGGSTYLICSVQNVPIDLGGLVEWNTPDLEQDEIEVWVPFAGTPSPQTILTGTEDCPEP